MDHRPANLPAPLCEILVHHDHIDRPADPADCIAQADRLGDAVLDIALDDQEVQIAIACELATHCRPEQDHPGRRARSLHEALSSQLDQLLRSHDKDSLPACAASNRSRSRNAKRGSLAVASYSCCIKIHPEARKHGIADADIEPAMKNAMAFEYQDDGRLLYLGHSRSGMPLGVVKVVGPELVIHAMKATRNHERLLLGYRALR